MPDEPLTQRERREWESLERDLRGDRALVRHTRLVSARWRGKRVLLPLMAVASLVLLCWGVVTSEPAVIAAFGVVWTATVIGAFRILFRSFS
ncbi:DUF3040 domain-containing protein [Streptomyces sp. NPDC057638]|uniref:DUF3040 domain-containing protein n=1 Tax=Streptomyces sp. NPDC057638 TaxID=3346190 RepID=UPI0036832C4F